MIWGVPSAVALVIKCVLFFYSDVYKQKHFFIFLLMTFWLNSVELLGFFRLGYDLEVLKLYYCAIIFTVFYLAVVCADLSQSCRWVKSDFALIVVCTLAAVTFLTDCIVLDFKLLPNGSITKISGEYYFVFQLYMVSALLLAFGVLIRRLVTQNDYHLKARCLIALMAFTPYIIVTLSVIALMQLGYHINVVGLSSLAICFMLVVLIASTDKHKLFSMMSFMPFSRERTYRLKLKQLLKEFQGPIYGKRVQMKVLLKELEALMIDQVQHHYTTQKELAHMFDISEANLSRKKANKQSKDEPPRRMEQ